MEPLPRGGMYRGYPLKGLKKANPAVYAEWQREHLSRIRPANPTGYQKAREYHVQKYTNVAKPIIEWMVPPTQERAANLAKWERWNIGPEFTGLGKNNSNYAQRSTTDARYFRSRFRNPAKLRQLFVLESAYLAKRYDPSISPIDAIHGAQLLWNNEDRVPATYTSGKKKGQPMGVYCGGVKWRTCPQGYPPDKCPCPAKKKVEHIAAQIPAVVADIAAAPLPPPMMMDMAGTGALPEDDNDAAYIQGRIANKRNVVYDSSEEDEVPLGDNRKTARGKRKADAPPAVFGGEARIPSPPPRKRDVTPPRVTKLPLPGSKTSDLVPNINGWYKWLFFSLHNQVSLRDIEAQIRGANVTIPESALFKKLGEEEFNKRYMDDIRFFFAKYDKWKRLKYLVLDDSAGNKAFADKMAFWKKVNGKVVYSLVQDKDLLPPWRNAPK